MLNVLQITDVHLLAGTHERLLGVDTTDSLRAVLRQALSERTPDALLATGDIAHNGEPETYDRFSAIVEEYYTGPRLVLPGNHDLWAPMSRYLRQPCVLSLPGWDLIGLDSHADGSPAAQLGEPDMLALREACAAAGDNHVLLATHHPPLMVDCPWLDKDRIQNADELLEWLSEHTRVVAMVFGHAHQIIESDYESAGRRIALLGTPSTCFQFAPRSEKFAIDDTKPGYRWLYLASDGGVTSEVRRVADYPLNIELPQRH